MTSRSIFSILSFLILTFFCTANAFAEDMQYDNQIIEHIEVVIMNQPEGSPCDAGAIIARIKSREASQFCQSEFDNDLKILSQDFDRVDPTLDCIDGKIFITLKIWPKPTIRTITWCGNNKLETSKLQKELGISTCAIFDRLAFNQAFHKLKAYYIKKGFFEAELCYDVISDPLCSQVDIQITIEEGRSGWIKEFIFEGFTKCEEEEILELMVTKEYCFFTSWMTDEGTYHEEAIQQDEFAILNYLQNKGYADATVSIDACEVSQSDRIIIRITAEKGCLYTFGDFCFSGNTLFPDEAIRSRFLMCEGAHYSPEKIRETVSSITDLYGRYGYIDAFVQFEPKLVCDEYSYDVELKIEEGEQFRVGLIKVFGNCSTQTNIILHEVLLVPGEVFNIEKLKKTEEKLTNIGYFKTVNVYAVKGDGICSTLGENFRDVHIEVEETSTGRFGVFAGFSTVENLFAGASVSENNFNISGLSSVFSRGLSAMRGGGEYAYVTATIGAKSRSYVVSWSKPWFMDSKWIVGFDAERSSNRYVSKDYDIESSSFRLHGMREINQFVRVALHYRIKNSRIDITEHHASHQMREEAHNAGLISAVGIAWIYDSTNHPVTPTEGFKSRVLGEFAGLGGKQIFLSFGYVNSYYWKFPEIDTKGVWKFRFDTRFIQPLGNRAPHQIPIDERYFLGGECMVRGYRPYKLGPRYEEGDPRGGISIQFISLEYSRFLYKKRVEGFAFADSGHLSMHRWHLGRMSTAVGLGLRITILERMPPLTVGMGFPIDPRSRGEVKRFFLSVGGNF